MGTTCACFREHTSDELIIINKEACFIKSLENSELIVDINPLTEQTSDTYLKSIIKLQCVLRGYIERKKVKTNIQTLQITKSITSSSNLCRDSLKEVQGNYPFYLNETVQIVKQKFNTFNFSEPLHDGIETTKHGPVKLENEAIYIGEWNIKLERHGRGCQNWIDGSLYEGYWQNDRANCKGRLLHADGDVYEGDWKDDKACGFGKYIHMDSSQYEGEWYEDKQHGHGIEIWPDGARYEGSYLCGRKHGKGKFLWADKSSYEGEFKENNIHGYGIYRWGDGRVYEGQWKDNKMDGIGKFIWNDGRSYEGDYVDDKKQGFGIFKWADGRKYEGQWDDGKQHGSGVFTNASGIVIQGEWKNGKAVSSQVVGKIS
ncbi:hypothetical protein SteCoe_5272 [Stentor coeruleus]|uniref:MORN repeat protein n=1 Tax=Stentor coeruleus TaxID=5963 RepID=A0A1R2CST0_9CILI|nr:hypothetical protein SteCoe_5272 [Stentor coeruleus]